MNKFEANEAPVPTSVKSQWERALSWEKQGPRFNNDASLVSLLGHATLFYDGRGNLKINNEKYERASLATMEESAS